MRVSMFACNACKRNESDLSRDCNDDDTRWRKNNVNKMLGKILGRSSAGVGRAIHYSCRYRHIAHSMDYTAR